MTERLLFTTKPVQRPERHLAFLLLLTLGRLGFQVYLYNRGFLSVSADEFARGMLAAQWATRPHWDSWREFVGIWLPFEKYLNGFALWLWDDVILAPRFTVFLFSCLLLWVVYHLIYHLYRHWGVAALATLILAAQPWFIWLSGSPMLEMYYLACFMTGFYYLIRWSQEPRPRYWVGSSIAFFCTCGFHLPGWILVALMALLTLPWLWGWLRQRQMRRVGQWIAIFAPAGLFILGYGWVGYWLEGRFWPFLSAHTVYSQWFYGGYAIPVTEKLVYYPRILGQNLSWSVILFSLIGLIPLIRAKDAGDKRLPFFLILASLLTNSLFNVFSGPPSAAPGRYALLYIILLSPYIGWGVYQVWKLGPRTWPQFSPVIRLFSLLLVVGLLAQNLKQAQSFPRGMALDAIATGEYLNTHLNQPGVPPEATFLVELHYWDFLGVQLTARHFTAIVFDRKKDFFDRQTPSLFLEEPATVRVALQEQKVYLVALYEADLKEQAEATGFLQPKTTIGLWTIYTVHNLSEP